MAVKDFVVKNGLQVTSNVLVGDYANTTASSTITNGIAASGNVGIGTSTVRAGDRLNVVSGNINIVTNGFGMVFPDGTYQSTASASTAAAGGTGAIQYASGTALAGDNTTLFFDGTNKIGIGTNDVTNAGFHAKSSLPALFDTASGDDRQLRVGNSATTAATLGYDPTAVSGYLRASPTGTSMISWSATGVGINGISVPVNALDIAGGAVIGSGFAYAGTATAPADGLLVQGAVGLGTTSTGTDVKLGIYGGNLVVGSSSYGIVFSDGSYQTSAFNSSSAVTSFSGGTTGLTPNTGTAGTITLAGTLVAANGGTGQSSYAVGDLLYASGSTALSKLSAEVAGNVLISGGTATAPSWGKVGLTTHVTGTLPVANGGTNSSSASGTALDNITGFTGTGIMRRTGAGTYTFGTAVDLGTAEVSGTLSLANGGTNKNLTANNGGIVYTDADSMEVLSASVTSGNVLISGGAGAPSWGQYYTNTNVPSSIVSRDASGNFSAGTITAATGLTVSVGGINVTGNSQITGNVDITGNLNISGTVNTINSNVLVVNDPIIYVGENNPANLFDLGIVAAYNDGSYKHTGLLHRSTTGKWVLFDNLVTAPGETINWTQDGLVYDDLLLGNIEVATGNVDISGAGKGILFSDDSYQTTAFNSSSAVTSFSGGTTGLTPATNTAGAITLAGTLGATNGGTGQNTVATGDLLYGSATDTWSKLASVAAGNVLISGGTATAPSWGKIDLTTHVSGTLSLANGGTNKNLTASNGGIVYTDADSMEVLSASATSGNVLISGGAGTPSWGQYYTNTNVPSSIVSRDASGNFAGNVITSNTITMTYTVDVTGTYATAASTSQVTIDDFAGGTYRAAEYQISMKAGTDYAISRLTVIHDGTTAYLTEYDSATTNGFLVNYDAVYNAGTVELKAAPTSATITEFKISRKLWVV